MFRTIWTSVKKRKRTRTLQMPSRIGRRGQEGRRGCLHEAKALRHAGVFRADDGLVRADAKNADQRVVKMCKLGDKVARLMA